MKRFLLAFAFFLITHSVIAATYFSQGSLDPALLPSWNTSPIGLGTTPGSFTNASDLFIIKTGDNMTTTSTWTFGTLTSTLQIQSGATLTGNNLIQFTGIFLIDGGGTYIHDNTATVASGPGMSIWGGTETFASTSTVEIRRWINNIVTLPASISWGNLTINVTVNIGGSWNQAGNLTTIQNNLWIKATGIGTDEFIFTGTTSGSSTIGGNLTIDGGILDIKNNASPGTSYSVQVNGNIFVNGGTLSTGTADAIPNAELRFKGNFDAFGGSTVTSSSNLSYLVANGTTQSFSCIPNLNCSFRVASGSTVTLLSPLTVTGTTNTFAIIGTFNQALNAMSLAGFLQTAGGTFNSSGFLNLGNTCQACTGDGTYNSANTTWCRLSGTGTKGTNNFSSSTISLSLNLAKASLSAGDPIINSPGDVYLTSNTTTTATGLAFAPGGYGVAPNSIFSIDATSFLGDGGLGGPCVYAGAGGTLRIGSADGITAVGPLGNVRTSSRIYNAIGTNNFEYFGVNPQVTGNGLPTTIGGTLKINNTPGAGVPGSVVLSQPTTLTGVLDLMLGNLTTTSSLLTLTNPATTTNQSALSFVFGPMKKIGDVNFIFPLGAGQIYAPLGMINTGFETATDEFTVEYKRQNPQGVFGATHVPQIDHVSFVEYWLIAGTTNVLTVKNFSLDVHQTSFCMDDLNPNPTPHTFVSRFVAGSWGKENSSTFESGTTPPYHLGTLTTLDGISNFSAVSTPYTIATDLPYASNPLPVNLIKFTAIKNTSSSSIINWELATLSSKDAAFEVERSTDNLHYSVLTLVQGSTTSRSYTVYDHQLGKGITYYRLKMIDENGKVTYSKTVAIINDNTGILITSIAPNPVHTMATLTISSAHTDGINFQIYDITGKMVKQWRSTVIEGNNLVPMEVSDLPNGVYQVMALTRETKVVFRFVKQ